MATKLCNHPDYNKYIDDWKVYRLVSEGGRRFAEKFLRHLAHRELLEDFNHRKVITNIPSHAKAAVREIRNAIYERLIDISRVGGPKSYSTLATGTDNGVDRKGNSMTSYIGRIVLPELLVTSKVGVFVDKPQVGIDTTLADVAYPYLYHYTAENILNWTIDEENVLQNVLLKDSVPKLNGYGLIEKYEDNYRLLTKTPDGIRVVIFDDNDKVIYESILNLQSIPFVIFELSESLLTDAASYQIALLNLASADIAYALISNFPFYVEQGNVTVDGWTKPETQSNNDVDKIKGGPTYGRRYPRGAERPAFIHPSSEPLQASMAKQDQLVYEIRLLVNLSVQNLAPRRASAESKVVDERTLEAGLSCIGLELAHGENQIGKIWAEYEGSTPPIVTYPTSYSLKSEETRLNEASKYNGVMPIIPSKTFQRAVAKRIAHTLLNEKITSDELQEIYKEIDAAPAIVTDPEVIKSDYESGFVSTETASFLRGYPKGQVEQATKDHAERIARIAKAQSPPGARGVQDMSANPDAGKVEKDVISNNQ